MSPVKGAISGGSKSFSTKWGPLCDARRLPLLKEKGFRFPGRWEGKGTDYDARNCAGHLFHFILFTNEKLALSYIMERK